MNNALPSEDTAKIMNQPCDCHKTPHGKYTEEHNGQQHVWTVNMDICENTELRKKMKKGAKLKLADDDANTVANYCNTLIQ